jgi:hypothetical protein
LLEQRSSFDSLVHERTCQVSEHERTPTSLTSINNETDRLPSIHASNVSTVTQQYSTRVNATNRLPIDEHKLDKKTYTSMNTNANINRSQHSDSHRRYKIAIVYSDDSSSSSATASNRIQVINV